MDERGYLRKMHETYKDIFESASNPPVSEQNKTFNQCLIEHQFMMQGKPFPTFLKPLFIEKRLRSYIYKTTATIMNCIEKVSDLFFSDPSLEPYFEMDALDMELARIDPRYPRRVINGRLDAFLGDDSLKFLEFNCDSPCGMGWHDKLIELFQEVPIIREFKEKTGAVFEPILPQFVSMLRRKNEQTGGPQEFTVAVATGWESTVRHDLELVAEFLDQQPGIHAFFWDPREAEYDGKFLRMNDQIVHVVFRDDIRDFTSDLERSKPVLDAFRDGRICFINPFSSRVGGLKCVLWFMTDERSRHLFTQDEIQTIMETIPWTRFMREGKTDFRGKHVDLFEFVRNNKDKFVLKPNAGYGGFGVTIGSDVDKQEWDRVLEQIASGESWVVQERVEIPRDSFPEFNGEFFWKEKNVNINFFAFDGQFGGGMVRVSDSSIINVHQGGGLIPICYV